MPIIHKIKAAHKGTGYLPTFSMKRESISTSVWLTACTTTELHPTRLCFIGVWSKVVGGDRQGNRGACCTRDQSGKTSVRPAVLPP